MAKYPFGYQVVAYMGDTFDSELPYILDSGMGICGSYTDAMSQIEEYYGTDLISIKYLELYAECSLIPMPMSSVVNFAESDWPHDNACIPCNEKGITRSVLAALYGNKEDGDEDASQKPRIMDNALAKPLDLVMEEMEEKNVAAETEEKDVAAIKPNRNTQLDVNFSMKPANAMETFGKGR
jgi:hypothetical protein